MSNQCNRYYRKWAMNRHIGKQALHLSLTLLTLLALSMGCAGTETASGDGGADSQGGSTSKRWYEDGITMIKTEEFETQVLGSEIPVVLEFFTPTCQACRMIAPIYEKMAAEYTGKVTFLKMNAKANRNIAKKYGIDFTPLFIVFAEGKEFTRHEGHRFVKPIGAALEKVMK